MAWLAETLSPLLGRPVLEKTGLAGVYDYKLEWTPDAFQATGGMEAVGRERSLSHCRAQEQLGLKLQAQKGPVEILVIDRAEKATAN